jgi:hypothetical protein
MHLNNHDSENPSCYQPKSFTFFEAALFSLSDYELNIVFTNLLSLKVKFSREPKSTIRKQMKLLKNILRRQKLLSFFDFQLEQAGIFDENCLILNA